MNIPNLFILGAPKCGTTSLAHYLGQHPDVCMSPVKEPHYFNFDLNHRYYFNLKEYLNLFNNENSDKKYICEASVWYLYSDVAVKEILKFNPKAKFIIMVREYSELFFSLHRELLYGGEETVRAPQLAWNLSNDRKKGNNIPRTTIEPKLLYYDKTCELGKQIFNCKQYVQKENLRIIFLEELKKNPDKVYNSILDWLEIKPFSLSSYDVINEKKQRKFPFLSIIFRNVIRVKRKFGIKRGLGIANFLNRKNVTKNVTDIESIKKSLAPEIKSFFKEDRQLLAEITNRNLEHWE